MAIKDCQTLKDIRPAGARGIAVNLPDGRQVQSTHIAELDFPQLPPDARQVHVFPDFDLSLLSIGQLCDNGMTATYQLDKMQVSKGDEVILTGPRDPSTGLWTIDLPPSDLNASPTFRAGLSIQNKTHADIVDYYHKAFFAPVTSSFYQMIASGRVTLPGLTADMIRKNPPQNTATEFGHLSRTRKGQRSTKPAGLTRAPRSYGPQDSKMFVKITHIDGQNFADLAGRFPYTSRRGHNYMLIVYNEETGYVHVVMLKSRDTSALLQAFRSDLTFWRDHNRQPAFLMMDNEAPNALRETLQAEGVTLQLAPPHNHRTNAAERYIRYWKEHFIAGLCLVDPSYPMQDWDLLVEQGELTLNLLHPSPQSPHISSWEHLRGRYDYNSTPIAPPGMRVVLYKSPAERASWAPHGVAGFYVGPAL